MDLKSKVGFLERGNAEMPELFDVTKGDLLVIMREFGDYSSETEFFDFFNHTRNQYAIETGIGSNANYNTTRDQFYKWMKMGMGIQKKNLTRDMAEYLFKVQYSQKNNPKSVLAFLDILKSRSITTQCYRMRCDMLVATDAEDTAYTQLFFDLISDLTIGAFSTPQKAQKAHHDSFGSTEMSPAVLGVPRYLTAQKYWSPSKILHRNDIIDQIQVLLLPQSGSTYPDKTNIVITGFGGWGKTSVARLLYSRMLNAVSSGQYDSIGWIDYHISLKNSILKTNLVRLFEKIEDSETRWQRIRKYLLEENSTSKILLFIDNVDCKANLLQDPQEDEDLQAFADCPNINLVLTSRLRTPLRESSFYPVEVRPLSQEQCVDLFYLYCTSIQRNVRNTEFIELLVNRANCHTLAVKLLACGALYEDIALYYREIVKSGFNFCYSTGDEDRNAARELKKLFDLRTRTEEQVSILWDFAVLPQVSLRLDEVKFLMAYTKKDLQPLLDEGWLSFDNGFFLHPLIKEVILLDSSDGKAPNGTMSHLIHLVVNNQFLEKCGSFSDIVRRIGIVEQSSRMLEIPPEITARFYLHLGVAMYEYGRMRLSSLRKLEKAQQSIILDTNSNKKELTARISYYRGYIMSTTAKYRNDAHRYLRSAMETWDCLPGHQVDADMARDHLGYVLSDNNETWDEAEQYLRQALAGREVRYNQKQDKIASRDYATTCDNLGFLLSKMYPNSQDAKNYLYEAYSVRKTLYEKYRDNATDVAWTAYNVARFLENASLWEESLKYYNIALQLRREQNQMYPGVYAANILMTIVSIVRVCIQSGTHLQEVAALRMEAIRLRSMIDDEHTGFYMTELDEELNQLLFWDNTSSQKK